MDIMRMLRMPVRLMDIMVRSGFRAVYSLALGHGMDGAGAVATADGMAGATTAPDGMVADGVVEAGMAAATTAGLDMDTAMDVAAMDTMAAATRTRATAEAITAVAAGSTAVAVASMAVGVVSTVAAVVDAGS